MRLVFTLLCLLVWLPGFAHASGDNITLAGMRVSVWQPATSGKAPVIIFSHGFHGCSTQSPFLMQAFAEAGYIVFAPNHRDAVCNGGAASRSDRPQAPFGRPNLWDEKTYADRRDDIRELISALKQDRHFAGRIDWSRLGLCGHSLGGYTVLGLGGAIPSWKLPGVKAILALAPYNLPLDHLESIAAPVMYQAGSRDRMITPSLEGTKGAYALSPAPKYFVEFNGANHFAWTAFGYVHPQITTYSLAFMNHYLKGTDEPQLTQPMQGVSVLKHLP
ncbi:MAG TPA: dienelactone hydrolase family protein [Rickettsiales bacterium]|nr:dienelactone hydrolase family protein [Rickettsiales bacterium]